MTTLPAFDAYARSYDLLYGDKDYCSETAFVHRQLSRLCPEPTRVLELGCGTGGHALPLAALGCDVTGIDISATMLTRAAQRLQELSTTQAAVAGRLRFAHGDMRDLRLAQRFDVVLSLFHVFSYQTSDDDLAATLATAAHHLKPGGVLLFDFWHGPGVLRDPPAVRVKRVADHRTRVTRLAEPRLHTINNTVNVDYHLFVEDLLSEQIEQVRELHTMRYWFWPELQRHMRAAGLQPVGAWGWLTEREAGAQDWFAYTACRRMAASVAVE